MKRELKTEFYLVVEIRTHYFKSIAYIELPRHVQRVANLMRTNFQGKTHSDSGINDVLDLARAR